jgi:hypothetical protein
MLAKHTAQCFCGAVEIEASGAPVEAGYCHCRSCRAYSGAPLNAFTLWNDDQIRVVRGAALLSGFNKSGMSNRLHCAKCGGHVMTQHPGMGLTDVFAALFATLVFRPTIHLNYADTVLPMKDGLPKLKDFPSHAGGSGECVPE